MFPLSFSQNEYSIGFPLHLFMYNSLHDQAPTFLTLPPSTSPIFIVFQLHWASCCSKNTHSKYALGLLDLWTCSIAYNAASLQSLQMS